MCITSSTMRKYFCAVILSLVAIEGLYFSHMYFIGNSSTVTYYVAKGNSTERYKTFDFDRAEWTVRIKKAGIVVESDPMLKSLMNEEVVKRIIHLNGTVQNFGCTNTTPSCKVAMHYDYKFKMRINTPPCCRKSLLTILEHFSKEYRRLGVDHILAFGGVIGYVRYQKMIPYDLDLDLIVDIRFWNTPLMKRMVQKMRDLYGHVVILKDGGNKLWVGYSKTNRNHVDIWPYKKAIIHGNWMVSVPHSAWKYQPIDNVFPLKSVTFNGMPMYIPRKPVTYLNTQYGEGNWEKEISCQITVNGKCLTYPSIFYSLFGLYWFV